jgi:hypothetical protein
MNNQLSSEERIACQEKSPVGHTFTSVAVWTSFSFSIAWTFSVRGEK